MNTKGIKFLAVLAVMVMAFAAIVALAPADKDVTAIEVYGNDAVIVDPVTITGNETYGPDDTPVTMFYISDDAAVKIKGLAGNTTFYVQNGKELELNIKYDSTPNSVCSIEVYSVTADQQRPTTSTVDTPASAGENGPRTGKIIINDTKVKFNATDGQSIIYNAMMPYSVVTHTTTGDKFVTMISTGAAEYDQQYATIAADDKLTGATIAQYVTVAPGQAIETDASVDVNCGIVVKKNTYTYYAVGINAGSETVANSDEVVTIYNGTIVVNNNSTNTIKATSATSTAGVTITGGSDMLTVAGVLEGGSFTVSGNVTFDANFENQATITLNGSANVAAGSAMKVTGTLILKNEESKANKLKITGNGTVVAQNEKLWHYEAGETTPELVFAEGSNAFAGQFDVYAITKVAEVREAFSTAQIERNQTFRVVDDTVVTTSLKVYGVLIIEPGVTLTITKTNSVGAAVELLGQYGQIINNGEILIKTTAAATDKKAGLHISGGYAENNGKIVASSDTKANVPATETDPAVVTITLGVNYVGNGKGFVNNGVISASKNDYVSLDDKFTNDKNGSVSVNGWFAANSLVNKGAFTANNAKIVTTNDSSTFTVSMKKGAVFNLVAAELKENTTLEIKDGSNASVKIKTDTPAGKYIVRGLTVTDTNKKLDISGTVSISVPSVESATNAVEPTAIMTLGGAIEVNDVATIANGYTLTFAAAKLNVPGTLTLSNKVTTTTAAQLNMVVDGSVICLEKDILDGCTYVAAKYSLANGTTIYTNIGDAVAGAILAEVAIVEVGSDDANKKCVVVTDDLYIPAGLTISGDGVMAVDEKATISVESGARLSIDTILIVDGMIVAEDSNDIDMDSIVADVKEEDDETTAAACMSLEVALMLATPGAVINLSNDFFAANTEIVIPEGVTVNATAAENDDTMFVLVNSNLVVNGTLVVNQFAFVATTDDTIGITVNGYIYDECPDGACFVPWWYVPFGVSYHVTDEENDQTWYVLTTIDNLQPAIFEADDAKVTIEGNAVLDDLTIYGRDDMPAEVTFSGNVDAGTITIEDTTLVFTEGKKITATVADAIGSITIIGAYAGQNLSIYSMDDAGVYMAGTVTDGPDGTYLIRFDGVTGMDGTTKAAIDWTSEVETPTILFAGETLATGKKVFINTDDENQGGMATITGMLVADNGTKIVFNCDAQVLGALVALERTEDAVAGSIEMNGDLFVGTLMSDIYSKKDAAAVYGHESDYEYGEYLGAAAVISGKIELGRMDPITEKPFFITVLAGSDVDPAIVEDLEAVDIIIDDVVWITIYGYASSPYSLDGLKAPIYNADAEKIVNAYDEKVGEFDKIVKVITHSKEAKLSEYGGYVTISLDYYVFNVLIKTDGSVKAVYIDGILMYTGQNENTFNLSKVATGTHKVTVEASTGYDADKCVLYTEMGTILPGMAFTFTEFDCEIIDGEYVVIYNINGTEIQPEPVPPTPEEESQWTITTILLVILVVLIAIMAVIVALRLNRS